MFVYPIRTNSLIHFVAATREDILLLQWKDLNFKTLDLSLHRSKELQKRSLQISENLAQTINTIEKTNDHIFTGLDGKPLKTHILDREVKRFQRHSGLSQKWNLKGLRPSYAAQFLMAGGS